MLSVTEDDEIGIVIGGRKIEGFIDDAFAHDAASPESTTVIATATTCAAAVIPGLNLCVVIRPVSIVGVGPKALSLKERSKVVESTN